MTGEASKEAREAVIQHLKRSLHSTSLYRRLGPLVFYARGKLFDLFHNVDTVQNVSLSQAGIVSPNLTYGTQYEGVDARVFKAVFKDLEIRHERFAFIDFGSGKGKALLMASEFPFRRITGVEFSPSLHRIAEINIRRYRSVSQKCTKVESICMDAASYPLPNEPSVFFLYNPFGGTVLESVIANIEASLESHPRDILIVYVNPELDRVLERSRHLRRLKTGRWHTIYGGGCNGAL